MPNLAEEAVEQLRTIRTLMERSTIYRAISAPAALFAGLLSLAVCAWLWMRKAPELPPPPPGVFFSIWMGVLAVVTVVNTVLLYRSARQRGEVFVSAGMKHALRALLPPLSAGFVLSLLALNSAGNGTGYADMVSAWILFYGLALLATGSFAPRSMQVLGGGFLAFGILTYIPQIRKIYAGEYPLAVIQMAFSFGLLHIVYAAAVFFHDRRQRLPSGA